MTRRALAAVGALVAAALVACGAASAGDDEPDPVPLVSVVDARSAPLGLAVGDDRVWAVDPSAGTLRRVDPVTGRVESTWVVGGAPRRVAWADGAAWVTDAERRSLVRVDTSTGQVTDRVPLGGRPEDVEAAHGGLWVALPDDGAVVHLDPSTRLVLDVVRVSPRPTLLAAGRDRVWVSDPEAGTLTALDPAGRRAARPTTPCGRRSGAQGGPAGVTSDGRTAWVACPREVVELDERTERVVRRIALPGRPVDVERTDDGRLVVALAERGRLAVVDTVGRERRPVELLDGRSPRREVELVVHGGTAWASGDGLRAERL